MGGLLLLLALCVGLPLSAESFRSLSQNQDADVAAMRAGCHGGGVSLGQRIPAGQAANQRHLDLSWPAHCHCP
jgi:hypothetical protein